MCSLHRVLFFFVFDYSCVCSYAWCLFLTATSFLVNKDEYIFLSPRFLWVQAAHAVYIYGDYGQKRLSCRRTRLAHDSLCCWYNVIVVAKRRQTLELPTSSCKVLTSPLSNFATFTLDLWLVHTADADETRQFCLVHVGGVNTIGDATELSCLVALAVWTQLQTRQDSLVSSVSAVWTSHTTEPRHEQPLTWITSWSKFLSYCFIAKGILVTQHDHSVNYITL